MQSKPTLKAYKCRIYRSDAQVMFFAKPIVTLFEQALVDDRIPYGLPKKPSSDETGNSTSYG